MKKTAIIVLIVILSLSASAQQRMCSGDYSFPGKVGIGTTSPLRNLHISASGNNDALIGLGNAMNGLDVGVNQAGQAVVGTAGELMLNAGQKVSVQAGQFGMFVNGQTGFVGINTHTPTQTLDVSGVVKATSLCIGADCRTSWPSGGTSGGITTESDPTVQSFAKQGTPTLPGGTSVGGNLVVSGQLTVAGQTLGKSSPVTQNCGAASCSASCPSGKTIVIAYGFHGMPASGTVPTSPWACGSAVSWHGNCIGQSSCSVSTGCSTSSMYILCA